MLKWLDANRAIVFSLAIVLVMRVWFGLWGAFVIQSHDSLIVPNPPWLYWGLERAKDEGWGLALAPWQRWDAIWYLRISQFGYSPDDMSTAFFPLFPLLTRAVALLVRDHWFAALIVTTAATFSAFLLIYLICIDLFDRATAERAVLYWVFFPTSFYLFAPYGESMLALSALAALFFARKKEWARAFIGAAGATIARPIGFLIAIPLVVEAWRAENSFLARARGALSLVAVPAAMGVWMLYLQIRFQDTLLWINSQDQWQRIFVWPGQTVLWVIQKIQEQDSIINNLTDLGLTLIVFAAVLAGWKKLPLSFSLYAIAMIIVPLLSYSNDPGFAHTPMAAAGRRAVMAFPAFIALGALWKGRIKELLWIAASGWAQVFLFSNFVQWFWVD